MTNPPALTTRARQLAILGCLLSMCAACGGPAIALGSLAGDADRQCIWAEGGETITELRLPTGWSAGFDPIAIHDQDGDVVVHEGQEISGDERYFPWEAGPRVCEVPGSNGTVAFREIYPGVNEGE